GLCVDDRCERDDGVIYGLDLAKSFLWAVHERIESADRSVVMLKICQTSRLVNNCRPSRSFNLRRRNCLCVRLIKEWHCHFDEDPIGMYSVRILIRPHSICKPPVRSS